MPLFLSMLQAVAGSDFIRFATNDIVGSLTKMRELLPLVNCIAKNAKTQEAIDLLPLQLESAGFKPGVFLEIGANDGFLSSQTLVLERCFGWQGILIEASPRNFARLKRSNRTATKIHSAACKQGGTIRMSDVGSSVDAAVDLVSEAYMAKWGKHMNVSHLVDVPCKELRDIIRDAGHGEVDFMSVDVQGSELHVLHTVNPESLNVVLVEAEGTSLAKNMAVRELLNRTGLRRLPLPRPHGQTSHQCSGCNDLFTRPALHSTVTRPELLSAKGLSALGSLLAMVSVSESDHR